MRQFLFITAFAVTMALAASNALAVPADISDGWPVVVYVLLGVAAAMRFLAGGFLAARMRHRAAAVGDDLVPQ
jgi:hypothetical protein